MKQRRTIRLVAVAICMMLVLGSLPIAAAGALADLDIRKNQSTASIGYAEGIQNINVHTAKADGYHFLLGASIVKYGDIWICAFGQSLATENDANTRFVCKYSYDNCLSWSEEEIVIADTVGEYGRGHGVLYNDGETLWAFCPKAKFNGDDEFESLDFTMEAYTLDVETMTWTLWGTVLNAGFWPQCEPILLSNGDLLIAGLECSGTDQAAVAIADGADPTSFEMVVIPNENNISVWGETTVIDYGDRLVAFVRTTSSVGKIAVSESTDGGRNWSSLVLSDMEATASKMYGGTLSTGSRYLIYNTGGSREKLVIAIGKPDGSYGFENIYLIKNGYEKNSQFGFAKQWAYPYAVEEDGKLYVVYAENKEDCELSVIPVSSLAYRETADVDVYETIDHTKPNTIPTYQTIAELVNMEEKGWWSGEGDGYGGVVYTTIDGVPVVAKQQTSIANQVLRHHFDVDISDEDYDRLAFEITFWYAGNALAGSAAKNRFFWGNSTSKSGENKPLSSDYTVHDGRRIEYNASTGELWSSMKQGWNTFFISFGALTFAQNLEELNTFFTVLQRNTSIADGEILYGISSLKLVRIAEPEEKELELRVENGMIQWRYGSDADWNDLLEISQLGGTEGAPGADGEDGAPGADGTDGKDGATWTVGEGAPTATANNGDLYLDLTTGDVYRYDNAWAKVGNIKGAQGETGPQGAQGEKGEKGEDGADASVSDSVNSAGQPNSDDTQAPTSAHSGVQVAAIVIAIVSLAGNGVLLAVFLIGKKKKA